MWIQIPSTPSLSMLLTVVLESACIFQTQSDTSGKRMVFYNDSAGNGGDVVYGGHMGLATTTDNTNCLLQFKHFSLINHTNTMSATSSQPSRITLLKNLIV